MKLALPLLLVTLALFCSDANAAELCPALNSVMTKFLLGTKSVYYESLKEFDVPEEARQSALRLKGCVDEFPKLDRLAVLHFVKILDYECNKQPS